MSDRKSATQIIIDSFLRDVEEKGSMPWQRPYERYNAFNYFSMQAYRGINRFLLPVGEYMTRNQINKYNETHGEDFRFQKGIKWYPVVFFKKDQRVISDEEMHEHFPSATRGGDEFFGVSGPWAYASIGGRFVKQRNILRYYSVAERKFFKNSKGEMLPSRIETGEVVITKQEPKRVLDSYLKRSGVKLGETAGTPCYIPALDTVELNPHTRSEEAWYSTAFHECGHSTGAAHRLNRDGVVMAGMCDEDTKAREEVIAEVIACLCCAETGINSMETSCSMEYDNNIAYVQAWKKKVQDWGNALVYIISQADKGFNLICQDADSSAETCSEEIL